MFENWNWLYKYHSRLLGFSFLFVYWDRRAEILEFNIFHKCYYFWVNPNGKN